MRNSEIIVGVGERITLSWRRHKHARYLAEEADDGTITLIPAALVPAYRITPDDPAGDIMRKVAPAGELRDRAREMPLWKERSTE